MIGVPVICIAVFIGYGIAMLQAKLTHSLT